MFDGALELADAECSVIHAQAVDRTADADVDAAYRALLERFLALHERIVDSLPPVESGALIARAGIHAAVALESVPLAPLRITSIDLSGWDLSDKRDGSGAGASVALVSLFLGIAGLPRLRRLSLNACGLPGGATSRILATLAAGLTPRLEELDLGCENEAASAATSRNTFWGAGFFALAEAISAVSGTLTTLNLSACGVYRDVMVMLSPALQRCARLQQLSLAGNGFRAPTFAVLAAALPALTQLESLDLGGNELGSEAITTLTGALVSLRCLRSLGLRGMGTKSLDNDEACAGLATALASLPVLEALDLRESAFGHSLGWRDDDRAADRAASFFSCIRRLPSLRILRAGALATSSTEALTAALNAVIGSPGTLESLQLNAANMRGPLSALLGDALAALPRLQHLDVAVGCFTVVPAVLGIMQSIARAPWLRYLKLRSSGGMFYGIDGSSGRREGLVTLLSSLPALREFRLVEGTAAVTAASTARPNYAGIREAAPAECIVFLDWELSYVIA